MSVLKKIIKSFIGQKNAWKLQAKFNPPVDKSLMKKRRDFYMQFMKKGDLYFDVGANFGNRIEPIINDGLRIVAVEPQEECLKYLSVRFKGDIDIVPKGLSHKKESRTIYVGDSNTISSFSKGWIDSVSETKRYGDNSWREAGQIEMITMDDLIEKFGVPNFVKIDVEGFELEVLKGLSQKIPAVSYEYTVPEETDKALECLDLLAALANGNVECNYSVGESMEWKLEKWLSYEEMKDHMNSDEFLETGFGDIYIKSK